MAVGTVTSGAAELEFQAASRGSLFNELTAILTVDSECCCRSTTWCARQEWMGRSTAGVHEIPLARIRDSEIRTRDFDSSFHPLKQHLRGRWTRLYSSIQAGREMPPIEVYRVGDVYFVRDGHHRVSSPRHAFSAATSDATTPSSSTSASLEGDRHLPGADQVVARPGPRRAARGA